MVQPAGKRLRPAPETGLREDAQMQQAVGNMPGIRTVAGDSVGPRLKGKVALVTGASSPTGMGRAAAYQFAQNGAAAVYLCDVSATNLTTHKQQLKALYPGVDVHVRVFDAADDAAVKAVVDDAVAKHGRLDVFFANAGVASQKHFRDTSAAEFERTMRINALSVFLAVKHASKAMLLTSPSKPHAGGSIIATASVAGLRSNAGSTDYSASKAAVVSIMQTAAFQLAGTNVRCNAVCPGLIETGMTLPVFESARKRGTEGRLGQLNPTRRGAVADEVARVVLFLASEEASYVNGQAWAVCGGLSAGHPFVPGKLA